MILNVLGVSGVIQRRYKIHDIHCKKMQMKYSNPSWNKTHRTQSIRYHEDAGQKLQLITILLLQLPISIELTVLLAPVIEITASKTVNLPHLRAVEEAAAVNGLTLFSDGNN